MQQCIILLEDIDAASLTQTRNTDKKVDTCPSKANNLQPAAVFLSTLLNAIDGVSLPEGHLLIMMTNHVEYLDEVLIRPGRVDRKIEFSLADEEMIAQFFYIVFGRLGSDVIRSLGVQFDSQVGDSGMLGRLEKEFTCKVPKLEFSPADILSFLLENKQSPEQVVDNVGVWVMKMREGKKKVSEKAVEGAAVVSLS